MSSSLKRAQADIVAALWPERVKALVAVSGYLIGSQEAGKLPLPPKLSSSGGINSISPRNATGPVTRNIGASFRSWYQTYAQKFSGKYQHRHITGGVGHNLPQEAPHAFAEAIIASPKHELDNSR
jgi:pimeloyl-ACP methyl ester carboxylesterase